MAEIGISRADAIARGLKYYFLPYACPKGHNSKRHIGGSCYECLKIAAKKYTLVNGKQIRKKRQEYYKKYREENTDKRKKYRKGYYENNKKNYYIAESNRRAKLKNAEGNHTKIQIAELYKKQHQKCANCFCSIKKKYHIDHIVALALGGSNYISNIQLLCPPCNLRKGKKGLKEWANQQGRII